jgi:hypothetical protein
MNTNLPKPTTFQERLMASLNATQDAKRWEQLLQAFLTRLELHPDERADAEAEYLKLADEIATRLDVPRHEVDVYAQGSMRTQTTIAQRGNAKFDIDVVVELSGPKYQNPDSEHMFEEFGAALEGNEDVTGEPVPRRRCWKLNYPGKPYYFDVTPAARDLHRVYGAGLRVRDPDTVWSPSNPKEFADWFCTHANKRFTFGAFVGEYVALDARRSIDPLPSEPIGLDDILRRTVQLMKLHRDNFYHYTTEERKGAAPISVIIVTLATHAFERLWATKRNAFGSPIEVVLAVVEDMKNHIQRDFAGLYLVPNPALETENFADRWNNDKGLRAKEFHIWHKQLEDDLEMLLTDEYSRSTEDKLRSVFGQAGADAWRASLGAVNQLEPLLKSLVASSGVTRMNPRDITPVSRKTSTLA